MELKLNKLSIFEFQEQFKVEDDCLKYLAELKWSDKPFICTRCRHTNACKGNIKYAKKCTRCSYQESVTAHTLFHKCKFSKLKAFWIIYFVSTTKGGISAYELSRKLDLRRKTCWLFKRKVMAAMESSEQYPMKGDVEVDEFVVGGRERGIKGVRGRKSKKKKLVVIAVEKKGKGVSRIYAREIKRANKAEIIPFMRTHIDRLARVGTDKWGAYNGLEEEFPNHTATLSNGGTNFDSLHRCIMMLKAWLRGTHHSVKDLQPYLDEYCYRFNRHLMKIGIFENIVNRMVLHKPKPYKLIKHN